MQALEELGFKNKVEVSDTATNLFGYQGDQRADTAEVILRRKHVGGSSNDIGFKLQEDGTFGAIISQYDSSRYNSGWLDKLAQKYAYLKVKKDLDANGFTINSEVDANGEITLQVSNSYYG